jgi:hypothetical protein
MESTVRQHTTAYKPNSIFPQTQSRDLIQWLTVKPILNPERRLCKSRVPSQLTEVTGLNCIRSFIGQKVIYTNENHRWSTGKSTLIVDGIPKRDTARRHTHTQRERERERERERGEACGGWLMLGGG